MSMRLDFLRDPTFFREILLTDSQIMVVKMIQRAGMMSAYTLSVELDIPVPVASKRLSKLYDKGYVQRIATGKGYEYYFNGGE